MPSPRAGGRTRKRHPAPVSPSLATLGRRIRTARIEAGVSQAQLGKPHFTRAYVSAVELGKIRPSMKSLEFLAGRLGKAVSFFLEDEDAERRRREREFTMLRAKELIARGEAREAVQLLEPMLSDSLAPLDAAHVHRLLGLAHYTSREARDAIRHLRNGIEILERLGRAREVQRARRDLAGALLESGAADQALVIYRQLLEVAEAHAPRDPVFRMEILRGLGAAHSLLGNSAGAISYYDQALAIGKEVGDLIALGRIHSGLAYGHWLSGDREAALGYMQRAIANHEAARDLGAVAELHNNLAVLCIEQKHLSRAHEHVQTGRQLAAATGRNSTLISLMNTQAELALAQGNLDDAKALCDESSLLAASHGIRRGGAAALRLLARIATAESRHLDARGLYEQAVQAFIDAQMRSQAAETLYELSQLLASQGEATAAAEKASRAYELSRPIQRSK